MKIAITQNTIYYYPSVFWLWWDDYDELQLYSILEYFFTKYQTIHGSLSRMCISTYCKTSYKNFSYCNYKDLRAYIKEKK